MKTAAILRALTGVLLLLLGAALQLVLQRDAEHLQARGDVLLERLRALAGVVAARVGEVLRDAAQVPRGAVEHLGEDERSFGGDRLDEPVAAVT